MSNFNFVVRQYSFLQYTSRQNFLRELQQLWWQMTENLLHKQFIIQDSEFSNKSPPPPPPQKKNWYEEQHIAPTDAFLREVTFFHVPLFNQVKQTAEYYLLQVSNFYSLSK
jgi:hypothetical protein